MKKKIIINSILFVLSIVGFVIVYAMNAWRDGSINWAFNNFYESLPIFVPSIIVFYLTGKNLLEIITK